MESQTCATEIDSTSRTVKAVHDMHTSVNAAASAAMQTGHFILSPSSMAECGWARVG
jgi:hypothetical protein